MYIDGQTIITAASILGAVVAIGGTLIAIYKWYAKQNKQDIEIADLKKENALICYGLAAALDGLMQLGANHSVPVAREKLEKYLNQAAHK